MCSPKKWQGHAFHKPHVLTWGLIGRPDEGWCMFRLDVSLPGRENETDLISDTIPGGNAHDVCIPSRAL